MGSGHPGSLVPVRARVCECGEYALVAGAGVFRHPEMYFGDEGGAESGGSRGRGG